MMGWRQAGAGGRLAGALEALGVSTRRVKEITTEFCGREFSKWVAPQLLKDFDEQVEEWSSRSLEEQNYPLLALWRPCTC